ncbi:alpha/beta fold hydrolase [Chitinibacter sp. ZOR0017]|uniref:alpha/beta fold hydrolase n=1 Tax=Chitinibacter sp. ZOR0017 TaxID=1339254 RepID=UPI0006483211|nr:alpha/beta hydrolase [Chitinibacter sp. ZOR0017]
MEILQRNYVQQLGNGEPMLLAHGFGCNQTMWQRLTPAFADEYRLILFDYVGSGRSARAAFDAQRYSTLQGYVADVLEICAALGISEGLTFVGHSVSASVGLLASLAQPKLIKRLILIGPSPSFLNHPPDYFGGFEQADLNELLNLMDQNYIGWANYLAPLAAGAPDSPTTQTLNESFCSTDPQVARVFARTTFFADTRAELTRITTPALIIQHERDALVPLSVGEYMHRALRHSQLEVLDVGGHCAHLSHPELVIASMRRFLQATASAPA